MDSETIIIIWSGCAKAEIVWGILWTMSFWQFKARLDLRCAPSLTTGVRRFMLPWHTLQPIGMDLNFHKQARNSGLGSLRRRYVRLRCSKQFASESIGSADHDLRCTVRLLGGRAAGEFETAPAGLLLHLAFRFPHPHLYDSLVRTSLHRWKICQSDTCIDINIYIYTHMYIYQYIHTYVWVSKCVCVCVFVSVLLGQVGWGAFPISARSHQCFWGHGMGLSLLNWI